jgi:hypothetical protein
MSRCLLLAALLMLLPGSALAVTIDLTGSAGQTAANTGYLHLAGGLGVDFDAFPGASSVSWQNGQGLGIDCVGWFCGSDSQFRIDAPEILCIEFTDEVYVDSIGIGNLFTTQTRRGWRVEGGLIAGDWFAVGFDSGDGAVAGNLEIGVNRTANWIKIIPNFTHNNDFTLRSISLHHRARPVPEASSVILFGVGMAVAGLALRKRSA